MASLIWTRLSVSHGRTKRTGYKPPVLSVRFVRATNGPDLSDLSDLSDSPVLG